MNNTPQNRIIVLKFYVSTLLIDQQILKTTEAGFRNDFLVRQIWIKLRIKTRTFTILNDLLKFGKILVHHKP